jgi:regulatory protein
MPGGRRSRREVGIPGEERPGDGELQRALSYAFKLLGYRQRSEQELRRRLLIKGFSKATAEEIARKLSESGYINDRATASALRLRAEEGKFLGLGGARQYLRRMGISRGDTDEALEGYDEMASAARLAEKKMNLLSGSPPAEARKKLSGYLGRRGFSYETVRKTIEAFIKEAK